MVHHLSILSLCRSILFFPVHFFGGGNLEEPAAGDFFELCDMVISQCKVIFSPSHTLTYHNKAAAEKPEKEYVKDQKPS